MGHFRITTAAGSSCYMEGARKYREGGSHWTVSTRRFGTNEGCWLSLDEVEGGDITLEYWNAGDIWTDVVEGDRQNAQSNGHQPSTANQEEQFVDIELQFNRNSEYLIQYDRPVGSQEKTCRAITLTKTGTWMATE